MKTVLMGLDGADPELIDRWIEDLPNFRRLKEEGFFGELRSIIPPITIPAWMCMISGKDPSFFDVNDFQKLDQEKYDIEYVDSTPFVGKTILNSEKNIISFLIPGTTPSFPVNGCMVGGYMVGEPEFYPKNLKQEVKENTKIDVRKAKSERKEDAEEAFKNNVEGFKWMLDNKEFDIALSVFQLIDFNMHKSSSEEEMKASYLLADRKLGEIIDKCQKEDWNLVVASDHGSTTVNRKLYLNGWLYQNGYLSMADSEEKGAKKLLYQVAEKFMALGLKPVLKGAMKIVNRVLGENLKPTKHNMLGKTDFENTEAFAYLSAGINWGAIWVNDEERFSKGIVEDREEKAKEIKKELEKEEFIQNVHLNSKIYDNPELPDLMVEADEKTSIGSALIPNLFYRTQAVVHEKKGVIAGQGPSFKKGKQVKADLVDVYNTLESIEGDITITDGRPLKELLKDLKNLSFKEDIEF